MMIKPRMGTPTHTNRQKRVIGRVVRRPSRQHVELLNEIADLKSKMKRNSIINWTLTGIDWIIKLVLFSV